jgi:8-oxo-dGTP diphosphatase
MIHEDTFKKCDFHGAMGLVFLGDKILVSRRDYKTDHSPGLIDLPGGGGKADESPFDTFRREVKEEYGLDIKKENIQSSRTVPDINDPEKKSFFFVTKALKYTSKDINFGDEGTQWFLMTPEEFVNRPDGVEGYEKIIKSYLDGKLA